MRTFCFALRLAWAVGLATGCRDVRKTPAAPLAEAPDVPPEKERTGEPESLEADEAPAPTPEPEPEPEAKAEPEAPAEEPVKKEVSEREAAATAARVSADELARQLAEREIGLTPSTKVPVKPV